MALRPGHSKRINVVADCLQKLNDSKIAEIDNKLEYNIGQALNAVNLRVQKYSKTNEVAEIEEALNTLKTVGQMLAKLKLTHKR